MFTQERKSNIAKRGKPVMTGAELKRLREQANVTQAKLGELAGYHTNNINAFECGRRPITNKAAALFRFILSRGVK